MVNSVAAVQASVLRMVLSPEQRAARVAEHQKATPAEQPALVQTGRPAETGETTATGFTAVTESVTAKASAMASAASGLSAEDLRLIDQLSATDRQVRTHELAHMAAGAGLAGGATFTYQVGPDNQRYAVAGEVRCANSLQPYRSINAGAGVPAALLLSAGVDRPRLQFRPRLGAPSRLGWQRRHTLPLPSPPLTAAGPAQAGFFSALPAAASGFSRT